jgi:hypothetical protein
MTHLCMNQTKRVHTSVCAYVGRCLGTGRYGSWKFRTTMYYIHEDKQIGMIASVALEPNPTTSLFTTTYTHTTPALYVVT